MLRLPLVLMPTSRGGGLVKMLPRLGPIRFPLAKVGHGRQPLPWVHVDDVVQVICMALERPEWRGPLNVVAPELLTNADFTRQLAAVTGRMMLPMGVPPLVLKLAMGEAAQLACIGQAVEGTRLQQQAYPWIHADLESALRACEVW